MPPSFTRLFAPLLVLAIVAPTGACDRSPNDADSPDPSTSTTAESAPTPTAAPEDETDETPSPDEETDETPSPDEETDETHADDSDTPDRLWIGRFSEHHRHILVDLDELDETAGISIEDVDFDAAGDAPYRSDLLPEPYRDLEEVDVLTSEGILRLSLDQITRDAVGPSGFVLRLVTESSDDLADHLDKWTLVAPAGDFADGASLELVDSEPAHAKAVPKIRDHVMGDLRPEQRDRFQNGFPPLDIEPEQKEKLEAGESLADVLGIDRTLDAEHMTTVDGDFPTPRTQFVTVNGPTGTGGMNDQQFPIVRAHLFATDTGEVTDTLAVTFGPNHIDLHSAIARAETLALADPDGDGTDGVLYRDDDDIRWVDFRDGELVRP